MMMVPPPRSARPADALLRSGIAAQGEVDDRIAAPSSARLAAGGLKADSDPGGGLKADPADVLKADPAGHRRIES